MSMRPEHRWAGIIAAVVVLAGCGGDDGQPAERQDTVATESAPAAQTVPPAVPQATAAPADTTVAAPDPPPVSPVVQYAQAGLPRSLIDAGCYACHDVNGVRIGPPLRAVAGLYRTDPQAVDKLTHKIIHGGGGVWGPTPMIAHPQLDEAQARAMVEAILTLN